MLAWYALRMPTPRSSDSNDDRRLVFRPQGTCTAVELVHEIADVLFDACEGGLEDALLDIRQVHGFESPGPMFRAWAVGQWAQVAGEVRVAMVARPEHISPEKIGLIVAAQEGLQANIFDAEEPAVKWLDGFSASRSDV